MFVIRIVSGLLDLDYSSGKIARIGLWRPMVRRWWKAGLASRLVLSYMSPGTLRKLWWISISAVVVNWGSIPDVIGLTGRRPDAAESVLQGRDVRSVHVCVLVPDSRGLDQNFHDVTIFDMGDVPESSVSLRELSLLRQQWPPAVLRHMVWLQQDLEVMRADAKRFRQTKPSSCVYYGTWIMCDMYQHVAKFHLDLAQLWRCPVSWCTVWKGTPQDCMDHVRGAHDVPWVVKSASIEQFVPPWTVRRQV